MDQKMGSTPRFTENFKYAHLHATFVFAERKGSLSRRSDLSTIRKRRSPNWAHPHVLCLLPWGGKLRFSLWPPADVL